MFNSRKIHAWIPQTWCRSIQYHPRGGPTCVHESLQVQCIDVIAVMSCDNVQANCTSTCSDSCTHVWPLVLSLFSFHTHLTIQPTLWGAALISTHSSRAPLLDHHLQLWLPRLSRTPCALSLHLLKRRRGIPLTVWTPQQTLRTRMTLGMSRWSICNTDFHWYTDNL